MAITHKYVDSTKSDANDGDTPANAYATMQKAIDSIVDGSAGNQINLTGTITLSTAVTWTSYSPTNSIDNPLMIRGYTSTANDGGVGEIDGGNAAASIFEAGSHATYVYFVDLKMHNTTADVIDAPSECAAIRCEVYNGGSGETVDIAGASTVFGCNIHTGTSGAKGILTGAASHVLFNRVTGHDDIAIKGAQDSVYLGNLIHDISDHGISMTSDHQTAISNTIVGDSTAGKFGILGAANAEQLIVLSNIFKDFGTGGTGAAVNFVSGGNALVLGHNNLHGNDDDEYENKLVFGLDLTANDTLTDPTFTDAGSDDYRVGTNAKADGYPVVFKGASLSTTFVDVGALQRQEAGGGGGGGGKQAGGGGGQVG